MTAPVHVAIHPLIQHKLGLMRKADCPSSDFRRLLGEIAMLLCYEVTRDLPLEDAPIETPLEPMMAPRLAGRKLVLAPVLRAGLGMLDGMLALLPSARIAHVGLYRDPATLQAVAYSFKAPSELELSHNFLWRATCALPGRGEIGIFNRSYYEEVLVARVHPTLLERQNIPPIRASPCSPRPSPTTSSATPLISCRNHLPSGACHPASTS